MGREPLPDGPWSGSLRQDPTTIPLEYQSVLRATVCVQSTAIVHHAVIPHDEAHALVQSTGCAVAPAV